MLKVRARLETPGGTKRLGTKRLAYEMSGSRPLCERDIDSPRSKHCVRMTAYRGGVSCRAATSTHATKPLGAVMAARKFTSLVIQLN